MTSNVFWLETQGNNLNGQISTIENWWHEPTNQNGPDSPTNPDENGKWKFSWDIDRSGHNYIANEFNKWLNNDSCHAFTYWDGATGHDTLPQELNFLMYVYITFKTGDKFTVGVAQGHSGTTNNWWVGSPSMLWDNTNSVHYFPLSDGTHSAISSINNSPSDYALTNP